MKRVMSGLTLFFLLLSACATSRIDHKRNLFGDLSVLPENDSPIVTYLPAEEPVQERPNDLDFVIDDFEKGLTRWSVSSSRLSSIGLAESDQSIDGKSVRVSYSLVKKRQIGADPDSVTIRIKKNTRFEAFKGLEFMARANNTVKVRVLFYEYNQITQKISAQEVWYKEIALTRNWVHFRIPFSEFVSEEYYEQEYIGDDSCDLRKIREVGFSIDNHPDINDCVGELYIDNLFLF